jgi:iron complex outermembrane recepter protein
MPPMIKHVLLRSSLCRGAAVFALVAAGPAFAQIAEPVRDPAVPGTEVQTTEEAQESLDASPPVDSEGTSKEDASQIVVTGTLVRGIAPPGANVIGVSQADVQATGATTTAQLLQTIPQLGNFNALLSPVGAGNNVTVNRPNLRNLPGFNTAGGSTTLVLMDGHRIVGMGVQSTTPDPDIIPPGALQRLEIVPDGGSAVYGSDAVTGVLNFITLKRFDGVKVEGHYGFAEDYHQADASVTAGKDWGSGSAYVSYNYAEHGNLFGRDRDYIRNTPDQSTGRLSIQCDPGTVQATTGVAPATITRFYDLPFTTATAAPRVVPLNQCDTSDDLSFYPKERRHSVLVGISQEVNESISVDLRGFYTNRLTSFINGPYRQTSTVSRATILSRFPTQIISNETAQNVSYLFGPADSVDQKIRLVTWGLAPTLTADLGGGWQLRLLGSYSRSDTKSEQDAFNATALSNAINAGLFNPYNPSASDPGALGIITNFQTFGRAKQRLADARAVVDGELFQLPGGGVKVAAGAEYFRENYGVRTGSVAPGFELTGFPAQSLGATLIAPALAGLPAFNLKRNVKSVFGEVVVPVFGIDNATTLFQELTFSAAGRYDDYSDVGSTFNPRLGVTWRPIDWIKLRGAWGKSFNAPSLADAEAAAPTTIFLTGGLPPADVIASGAFPAPTAAQTSTLAIRGNAPGIGPQKAKTYTLGFDVQPPFIEGLNLSVTYYNIKVGDLIGLPSPVNSDPLYRQFPDLITLIPAGQAGADLVAATIASATPGFFNNLGGCATLPTCVYSIRDIRKNNLGKFRTDGLDFNGAFHHDTSFGSINFGINANYILTSEQAPSENSAFIDLLNTNSRFRARFSAGVEIGNLLAQATLNHNHGFKRVPPVGFAGTDFLGNTFVQQTKVDDFNVLNLFFRYGFEGDGYTKDLEFTVNVDNVFNTDPPFTAVAESTQTPGVINGNTLGRLIQFGLSKKF